jgi:hypothetical protein
MPSLFLLRGHQLIDQPGGQKKLMPPQTVHYKHTVRMLPSSCCHEEEIEALKRAFRDQLDEKDAEIDYLKNLVQEREHNFLVREEENGRGQHGRHYGRMLHPNDSPAMEDYSRIEPEYVDSRTTLSMN